MKLSTIIKHAVYRLSNVNAFNKIFNRFVKFWTLVAYCSFGSSLSIIPSFFVIVTIELYLQN